MNNIESDYLKLVHRVLTEGIEKKDRTGTGTISVFGAQIVHDMSIGFPLLTTKKMPFKTIATELMWFLQGDTNIKYLVDNNCHIWDGDAYKAYLNDKVTDPDACYSKEEFIDNIKTNEAWAKAWGELGPIYGKQWRDWSINDEHVDGTTYFKYPNVDQIRNLINDLKTNPDSRRLMVSAWNVGELDQMVLPPCHYGFQVYTRELTSEERLLAHENKGFIRNMDPLDWAPSRAISLMWNQRSADTFLGLPFNIASYALLLEIIAKEVNMVPDKLIGNLGDVHLYSNHLEQAKEQITREPHKLPKLILNNVGPMLTNLENWRIDDFSVANYEYHPAIKAPLSN